MNLRKDHSYEHEHSRAGMPRLHYSGSERVRSFETSTLVIVSKSSYQEIAKFMTKCSKILLDIFRKAENFDFVNISCSGQLLMSRTLGMRRTQQRALSNVICTRLRTLDIRSSHSLHEQL